MADKIPSRKKTSLPKPTADEVAKIRKPGNKPAEWGDRTIDATPEFKKRTVFPIVLTILIAHFVFAFTTLFMMQFFGMFLSEKMAELITYIVCIPLFCAMIYSETWKSGQQDYNLVKFGHMDESKLRGFKAGLVSQVPGLLLAALTIVHLILKNGEIAAGVPADIASGLHWGIQSAYHLFYCPFVGILWPLEEISPFFCVLPAIVAPIVAHIGYTLGYRRFSIKDKMVYTQKPENNDTHEQKFH